MILYETGSCCLIRRRLSTPKKGLILNSSDISKTIIANVDAAEHKGVVVPQGTPVGYVLTVNENNQSAWAVSNVVALVNNANTWTNEQEFEIPPRITYNYTNFNSNQVATTEVVASMLQTSNTTNGLPEILVNNPIGSVGQTITLVSSNKTSTWSASELRMTNEGTQLSTIYSQNNLYTNGLYTITAGNQGINLNGQFTFDTPPHSVSPILGNDLATKGYVDRLIGNYSGSGVNLYLNPGMFINNSTLSPSLSSSSMIVNTYNITTTCIAVFTTEETEAYTYPNTTSIPSGIWNMTLYGKVNTNTKILKYYFELYKVSNTDTETLLLTSSLSPDIDAIASIPMHIMPLCLSWTLSPS